MFEYTVFSSCFYCQINRVTDEALIAETAVWPNFFLMNVFLKDLNFSLLFIRMPNIRVHFTLLQHKLPNGYIRKQNFETE